MPHLVRVFSPTLAPGAGVDILDFIGDCGRLPRQGNHLSGVGRTLGLGDPGEDLPDAPTVRRVGPE